MQAGDRQGDLGGASAPAVSEFTPGSIRAATADLERRIEAGSDDAAGHSYLGLVHVMDLRPDKAIPCFRRALQLEPEDRVATTGLIAALQMIGEHREADRRLQALGCRLPVWHRLRGGVARQVALTIDDAPAPDSTPALLEALASHAVRATFFVIGENAARYPELVRQMVAAGHEVYGHGWDHRAFNQMAGDAMIVQLDRTEAVLATIRPTPSPYWVRLPYGQGWDDPSVHEALGRWRADCRIVQWSLSPREWRIDSAAAERSGDVDAECARAIAAMMAVPGIDHGIVLAHDRFHDNPGPLGTRVALATLRALLATLAARGWRPIPLAAACRAAEPAKARAAATQRAGRQVAEAMRYHQEGRIDAAEGLYREVLTVDPDEPLALHFLGAAALQRGRHDDAATLIGRALAMKPDLAEAHSNLGIVLRNQGKLEAAAESYRRALALAPAYRGAMRNLGNVLVQMGKAVEAAEILRGAIANWPGDAQLHADLGYALIQGGKQAEAVPAYRQAAALAPTSAEFPFALGTILQGQKQPEEAVAAFRQAIALKPGYVQAHNNLAAALQSLGRLEDAAEAYRQTIALQPDFAAAHNNFGSVRLAQGQYAEAYAAFQRAIALDPRFHHAWFNLGNIAQAQGDFGTAAQAYRQALQGDPDNMTTLIELTHVERHACVWAGLAASEHRILEHMRAGQGDVIVPFVALTLPATAADQLVCARRFAATLSPPRLPAAAPAGRRDRIRLGYLSADYREHATAYLIAELFERHDRARFEVLAYSHGRDDGSAMRHRLMAAVDRFVEVRPLDRAEAAARIRDDGVDILIDLKGYTAGARPEIVATRPAPVQVNYLGYPGTMGADAIDYIIGDAIVTPMDDQPFFAEKIVQLPRCYQVNDSRRPVDDGTPSRSQCGLPEAGFVFCCLNASYKITPAVFDVWMRLLQAVPGSVLWLLDNNGLAGGNLAREAAARGVAPERLVFAGMLPLARHLARYRLADLFLDTLPVNAHTTASDALWVGLPVLTCKGGTFASRVAASLLRAVGLDDLVTGSLAEYEALALKLARQPDVLAHYRHLLAANRAAGPLFDAPAFARDIERAYTTMWDLHLRGEPPRAFALT